MEKILIVVDMQKDFVDGALGTPEAQAIVEAVVQKIRSHTGPIIATYDTHYEDYMHTAEGKNLPVPHCIRGTEGWQLDSRIAAALEGKPVRYVEKPTFGSVALPGILSQAYDMTQVELELVGLCTDICVISNALLLKAHFPEIPIFVDAGCCAGVTPATHEAALAAMRCCQIGIKEALRNV